MDQLIKALLCLGVLAPMCHGQAIQDGSAAAVRRFEVGGQLGEIGFSPCNYVTNCPPTPPRSSLGVGGSWNVSRHFAIDSTLNFLLKKQPSTDNNPEANNFPDGSVAGGRGVELLAGPRAEVRGRRLGFFVDARGGFLSWSRVYTGYTLGEVGGFPVYLFGYGRRTFPALGFGGGVDYALTRRLRVRAELGDQIMRYTQVYSVSSATGPANPTSTLWKNAITAKTGVYMVIGHAFAEPGRESAAPTQQRFVDRANVLLIGASVLAQTADGVTTQRFLHHGIVEQNAFARPLVNEGVPGQVGAIVLATALEVSVMYGLHRLGYRKLERALPAALAAASGFAAYHNVQNERYNQY